MVYPAAPRSVAAWVEMSVQEPAYVACFTHGYARFRLQLLKLFGGRSYALCPEVWHLLYHFRRATLYKRLGLVYRKAKTGVRPPDSSLFRSVLNV